MENLMNMEDIRKIYFNMIDDESKATFFRRLQHSITGDFSYMLDMKEATELKSKLKKLGCEGKKFVIFGAGVIGQNMVKYAFKDIKWECFADNNVKNKVLDLDVIDVETLFNKHSDDIVVISPLKTNSEIYDQLIKRGFKRENIFNFGDILSKKLHKQYFEIKPEGNKKESFVDCGCFNGDTSKQFIEWCGGNYSKIWAFEPDSSNYKVCKKELSIPNCTLYNKGTFDKECVVSFVSGLLSGSAISDDGATQIETVKLDTILEGEEVTFIKMDVEGAELKSLQGAEKIIREQKPKLAICVYHKPEDIITIPKLILEYNPDYKFKLEHYTFRWSETVLYAF